MAKSTLTKFSNAFFDKGVLEFSKFIGNKLVRKFIYKHQSVAFLRRDMSLDMPKYKVSKRWYIREFTQQDLSSCHQYFPQFISDYSDLLTLSIKAFGAFDPESDNVLGITWYADKDFYDQHYLHQTFYVQNHQVFQFAGVAAEPYRNTQIGVNVMQTALEYWRSNNKTELTTVVDTLNKASMGLLFRVGWEEEGKIQHFYTLFGYQWQKMEFYQAERFAHFKKKKRIPSKKQLQ